MSKVNFFSILTEETERVTAPKSKKAPELKKTGLDLNAPKAATPSSQTKSSKDAVSTDRKQHNKSVRSGLPSSPRPAQSESSVSGGNAIADHIKEENRPSRGHARAHREAPAHGREYDRHSATGHVDGEKKNVAGHSWGKAVDVPEGISAEEALKIVESDKTENASSKHTTSEEAPAPAPVKDSQTYNKFLEQRKAKQFAMLSLKQAPRKPNEGNFETNEDVSFKVLSKSTIKDNDSLAGLLKGSPKASAKKNKKEKKEKETIVIEPRFSFDKLQRPNRNSGGAARTERSDNRQVPRPQFNNRSATVNS